MFKNQKTGLRGETNALPASSQKRRAAKATRSNLRDKIESQTTHTSKTQPKKIQKPLTLPLLQTASLLNNQNQLIIPKYTLGGKVREYPELVETNNDHQV